MDFVLFAAVLLAAVRYLLIYREQVNLNFSTSSSLPFFCILEGSQELLDSWLTLVNRLVNSETLLDSPHSLPATSTQPGFVPFKPVDFLVTTQKVCGRFW